MSTGRWIYEVKTGNNEWVKVGYEFSNTETESEHIKIIVRDAFQTSTLVYSRLSQILFSERNPEPKSDAFLGYSAETCKAIVERMFSDGLMRWRYEPSSGEDMPRLGSYYDAAWRMQIPQAVEASADIEWQIFVNGKWQDASFINPSYPKDLNTVIGHLINNSITLEPLHNPFLTEVPIRGSDGSAMYFTDPRATEVMINKGLKRNLIRRKLPSSPASIEGLTASETPEKLLKDAIRYLTGGIGEKSGIPWPGIPHETFLQIANNGIKFQNTLYPKDALTDLIEMREGFPYAKTMSLSGVESTDYNNPKYDTVYIGSSLLQNQTSFPGFLKTINKSAKFQADMKNAKDEIPRHLGFASTQELYTLQDAIKTLKGSLKDVREEYVISAIPGLGSFLALQKAAETGEVTFDTLVEGGKLGLDFTNKFLKGADMLPLLPETINKMMPWVDVAEGLLGLKVAEGVESYLIGLNAAVDNEIKSRGGESPQRGAFRQAAWREVEFSARAWKYYKQLAEARIANVGYGLDETEKSNLRDKYFGWEYLKDSYKAVMKTNQLFLDINAGLISSQAPGNIASDLEKYGSMRDIIEEYLMFPIWFIGQPRQKKTPSSGGGYYDRNLLRNWWEAPLYDYLPEENEGIQKEYASSFSFGSDGASQELFADFSLGSTSADFGGFQGMGTNQSSGAGTSASGGEGAALPYTGFSFTPSPFISPAPAGSTRGGGGVARMPSSGIPTIPMPRAAANRGAFAFAAPSTANTITPTGLKNVANTSMPRTEPGSFSLDMPGMTAPMSGSARTQNAGVARQPVAKGQQVIVNNNYGSPVKGSSSKEEFLAMLMQEDTSVA